MVLLISFQNRDPEMPAIGSHLRYFRSEWALHHEIDLARSLESYRAFSSAIFFGDARSCKRSIFKLNVHLAMNRTHRGQTVYFSDELRSVGVGQGREEFFDRHWPVDQMTRRGYREDQRERERDCQPRVSGQMTDRKFRHQRHN